MRSNGIALAVALWLAPRLAEACDPPPMYVVDVKSSDAPACLVVGASTRVSINGRGGTPNPERRARLDVDNRCTEAVTMEATKCDACGPPVTVEAGAKGEFAVETRGQSEAIDYGKQTKQALRWTLGAKSGAIATEVSVRDNVETCRKARSGGVGGKLRSGCSCTVGATEGGWWVGFALVTAALARRRGRRGPRHP